MPTLRLGRYDAGCPVTSTRGSLSAARSVHAPAAVPEARPERAPTRSTSAGLCMGATWSVSWKQRQGTADRVGEVYRVRWSR